MPVLKEYYLHQLLQTIYESDQTQLYDYAALVYTTESEEFLKTKLWADQLVRDKLVAYTDEMHSTLSITNLGKFWIMNGGYESFLKESKRIKDPFKEEKNGENPIKKEKEELMEARLKLTHYRLYGFWLSIFLSGMGFLLSVYNFYMIMSGKK